MAMMTLSQGPVFRGGVGGMKKVWGCCRVSFTGSKSSKWELAAVGVPQHPLFPLSFPTRSLEKKMRWVRSDSTNCRFASAAA